MNIWKEEKMKRQMISCLMVVLLFVTIGVVQSHSKRSGSRASSNTVTDIRKVDFRNFTYHSSLCSQEYGRKGIGKIVTVRNGEFKNKSVYFDVVKDKIIYADLNGDGSEEAIVPIDCGATGANFSRSEVQIYTIQNGSPALVAGTNDKDMERDYRANYTDAESYWGINENGIKANNGNVAIDVLVDGSHAAPKYVVSLEYRLTGKTLRLIGKPQRTSFRQ
jgi:hypothetical protein